MPDFHPSSEEGQPTQLPTGSSGEAPELPSLRLLTPLPDRKRNFLEGLRALCRRVPRLPEEMNANPVTQLRGIFPAWPMFTSGLYHLATVLFLMNPLWVRYAGSLLPPIEKREINYRIEWVQFTPDLPDVSSEEISEETTEEANIDIDIDDTSTARNDERILTSESLEASAFEWTLIQPDQPTLTSAEPLTLPNMVIWQQTPPPPPPEPAEPVLQVNLPLQIDLSGLTLAPLKTPDAYRPDDPADMGILQQQAEFDLPEAPKLQLDMKLPVIAGPNIDFEAYQPDLEEIDPQLMERLRAFLPAPNLETPPPPLAPGKLEMAALNTNGLVTLLALTPDPPPPTAKVEIPSGNQRASFNTAPPEPSSDDEPQDSKPGGNGTTLARNSDIKIPGITIKNTKAGLKSPNGRPKAALAGVPGRLSARSRQEQLRQVFEAAKSISLPGSAAFNIGAPTPSIRMDTPLRGRRIHTVYINMPNLTSASGSWILEFAVIGEEEMNGRLDDAKVESPRPLRKVDPRYDAWAKREGVEGTVVVYAVITSRGLVEQARILRGLDERLDLSALNAFEQWEFQPAARDGEPVAVEAVVRIPFRAR